MKSLNKFRHFSPIKTGIRIGRASDCEVVINDKNLSRYHCRIYYDNNIGWIIHDGCAKLGKSMEYSSSKNGTWLFVQNDMIITDGLIFKNNEYIFECEVFEKDET